MSGGVWTSPVDVGVEAVPTTLLTNIADNLRCLYMGGGQVGPATINVSDSIDIGSTYDTFNVAAVTNPDDIIYISTTGRNAHCKIWLINTGTHTINLQINGASAGAGYAKILDSGTGPVTLLRYGVIGLIYSGSAWHIMRPEY